MDLFQEIRQKNLDGAAPLAVRMRPRTLTEFVGQEHFLGEGKLLRRLVESDFTGPVNIGYVLYYASLLSKTGQGCEVGC